MPTYQYKCDACGFEFEKFQSITAATVRKCPKCGKNQLRRLIGAGAGLIFKGEGFYTTDYRSEAYKKAAKSDSGVPAAGAATAGAAAEGAAGAKAPEASKPKDAKPNAAPAAKAPPAKRTKPAR
ncbi:MAG: zinc ribbon domain-containing protein [Tepidisphaeraceae bacterium]|jgi:putative FmdB family regulatory protein